MIAQNPNNVQLKLNRTVNYEMMGTVLGMPDRPNLKRPADGIKIIDKAIAVARELRASDANSTSPIYNEAVLWGKRSAMIAGPRQAP